MVEMKIFWPIAGFIIYLVVGFGIYLLLKKMFLSFFGSEPAKVKSDIKPQATVKPQAPTEEELLLAMSDTELLRELVRLQRMSLRSQQSQIRVSRLGIFSFLALLSGGE